MSPLTTHVLDVSLGRPAKGVPVTLDRRGTNGFEPVASGTTDSDGRLRDLLPRDSLTAGVYRLTFDTEAYFTAQNTTGFYPSVTVVFTVTHPDEHHHVPLLLSPFGYSTYRGS